MVGIADVARAAGVSKATASRALSGTGYVSETTRDRVRAVAGDLGYIPSTSAVTLATGRTRTVGVVLPYVTRWFFAEVLEGIQSALLDRGWDLTLYEARPGTDGRARIFDDFLARGRFDGLVAVGLEPEDHELERLMAIGRPVVSVVGGDDGSTLVAIDDEDAARRATDHLIGLGHRDIAFLGGDDGAHWAAVDRRRFDGHRAAMADAGLSDRVRHLRSPVTLPGGYAAAVDALADRRGRPTGLVGACDEVAIGAIIAARRLGIAVPASLSVVGVDDHEFAEMFSLTTLRQVPRDQGIAAVDLLMARIADPTLPAEQLRSRAQLVVRNSTAAV